MDCLNERLNDFTIVEYSTEPKFMTDDIPVQLGQNKQGHYRLPSVRQKFPLAHLSYTELIENEHIGLKNFVNMQERANIFKILITKIKICRLS